MARVFIGNLRSVVMSEWCLNSAGIKVHFVPLDTNWLQIEKVTAENAHEMVLNGHD